MTWVVAARRRSHVSIVAAGLVRGRGNDDAAGQVALPYGPTSELFFAIAVNAAPSTPALTAPETHWPWLIVAALAAPVVPKIPRVAIAAIATVLVKWFIWLFLPSRRDDARCPAAGMASVSPDSNPGGSRGRCHQREPAQRAPVVAVTRQLRAVMARARQARPQAPRDQRARNRSPVHFPQRGQPANNPTPTRGQPTPPRWTTRPRAWKSAPQAWTGENTTCSVRSAQTTTTCCVFRVDSRRSAAYSFLVD